MKNLRQQLDVLLSETPSAARAREQSAFDRIAGGRRRIVVLGAGRLGRKIVKGLAGTDLEPIAFTDNNPALWGTVVDELPVLGPKEAAERYSADATFVAAIWHPSRSPLMAGLLAQLGSLGCRATAFPLLFWRHAATFLPYYFWELPSKLLLHGGEIAAAFELLDDDVSRNSYVNQIQLRLHADFDCIGAPSPDEQYFPGLFSLSSNECFVDCGSYTGDTLDTFVLQSGNSFRKMIAFEADPGVLPELQSFVSKMGSRACLQKAAVGNHNGVVRFSGDGIGGGCVTATAGVEVPCVRLDDALADENVSFIKMDIEGAEIEALAGARCVTSRDRPVLAVCGYHQPDHLWRVPETLSELAPDFSFYMRSHCADGLDTVYYAVPAERRTQPAIPDSHHRHAKSRTQTQGSSS